MKKHRKLITALLTLSLCASCFTMTAHAEPENSADALSAVEEPQPPAESSVIDAPADESSVVFQDPDPEPAPDNESSDVSSAVQQNNNYNYNNNYYNEYDSSNYYPESSYVQEYDYNDGSSSNYNQGYYVEDQGDNSSNISSNNYNAPQQNIAPTAELYNTDDRKIDDNELSDKDWKEIQAVLSNAKNSSGDSDDFSFIKNNVSTNDNGDWMLIAGVAAVLISLAGITYFIISTVNQRKKTAAGTPSGSSQSGGYSSPEAHRRSVSDSYNDGYKSASPRKPKKPQNRSKFDTAEIPQTRNQNNGRRYR